jgi:hypothetical protein
MSPGGLMRSGWFNFMNKRNTEEIMTEDEFRILERLMAINRGELLICGHPPTHQGVCGISWCGGAAPDPFNPGDFGPEASVEWPEHMIEAECTRLLEMDGWRALRTDPVSDRGRGKGFGEVGMADHLYFRYHVQRCIEVVPELGESEVLWIEFKSAKSKPKPHQIDWHTKERARGALTWIAGVDFPASVAGFVEHYRASGLNRGRV